MNGGFGHVSQNFPKKKPSREFMENDPNPPHPSPRASFAPVVTAPPSMRGAVGTVAAEERQEAVKTLAAEGHSEREIKKVLGVDPKTIRKDLKRRGQKSAPKKAIRRKDQRKADAGGDKSPHPLTEIAAVALTNDARQQAETKAARATREAAREQEHA